MEDPYKYKNVEELTNFAYLNYKAPEFYS